MSAMKNEEIRDRYDWPGWRRELQRMLSEATASLATAAIPTSDGDGLDAFQSAAYELAFAAAEIAAFDALVASEAMVQTDLKAGLCATYAGNTLPNTLVRLDLIAAQTGGRPPRAAGSTLYNELIALRGSTSTEKIGERIVATANAYRDITTGEDADMARDAFWRFGQEVVVPLAEQIHRQDLTIPEAILAPLREMGVFGLAIPQRYGGVAPDDGENSATMMAITEALSAASLGAAGSLITRPEILARAILAGATDEQKAHWLPRIAAGDPLCAISITEPDYGSDVASLALKATKVEGGWHLDGAKTWCTFAGKAGLIMVVARTGTAPGHRGLSLFLVEKDPTDAHEFRVEQLKGGSLTGKSIPTIGYRGMHSYDMAFTDFFIPDGNLIGGESGLGQGFYMTMTGMVGGRMQTSARACGLMIAAIDAAIDHVCNRRVFGTPLADYQLVRIRIADMVARFAACRALAYGVARLVDAGGGKMEASLAKLLACRAAEQVTRDALQLLGGMGYAEEAAVSRYFVDARVLSIFEGAEETLALKVIARDLVARSRKEVADEKLRCQPVPQSRADPTISLTTSQTPFLKEENLS